MSNTLSVSIIIPNWNGRVLLEQNVHSVLIAAKNAEVIVADDASTDDSVEFLKKTYPHVIVVPSQKRLGFSGNVNNAVAKASGEIVVLLNTDVRPEAGFLDPLREQFTDDRIAAVGCMEKSYEPNTVVLRGRGKASWINGFFIHTRGEVDKTDTAWVSGGSGAYRKHVWDALGGMDPLFNPFYWEDIDLSYQIQKAGYTIVFERKSIVHHFHEVGAIKTSLHPAVVQRIVYRNQFMFMWKNISDFDIWLAHMLWTPIRLVQALVRADWAMIVGYLMAIVRLPAILRSRNSAKIHWRKKDADIFSS